MRDSSAIYSDILVLIGFSVVLVSSVCRIFQEADLECEEEKRSVGLLDSGAEEPQSKALRYGISGVALALLFAAGAMVCASLHAGKTHRRAFHGRGGRGRYAAGLPDLASACGFSYQDFLSFWGPNGLLQPDQELPHRNRARCRQRAAAAWWWWSRSARTSHFRQPDDAVKSAQNREVELWVERSDQSMGFPPP